MEVAAGEWDKEFIVDAIQGGAGTSTNMNANEVIANRAIELLGGRKGDYSLVHPNDDVNCAQSTNDVYPTAGKLAALQLLQLLIWELDALQEAFSKKSEEFSYVKKMGRTQLQDAVPMRLGDSFKSYHTAVKRGKESILHVLEALKEVNLGGTAIGNGVNASEYYQEHVVEELSQVSGIVLTQAEDLFDATQHVDVFIRVSAELKACALSLSKICNDLRLLSSGPRTGIAEIRLPARQNGSSIMPGKVNPVIPEVVSQIAYKIAGNDTTISMAAEAGQLELNAFEPVIFQSLFESIEWLSQGVQTLRVNCVEGIEVNEVHCAEQVENSLALATLLAPLLGYQRSSTLAKEAHQLGVSVKEVILEKGWLSEHEFNQLLNQQENKVPITSK
jgi:aspartate ammonia-lyase